MEKELAQDNNLDRGLDTETFVRVRKWYVMALAAIAFTILFAQILIQQHLNGQLDDSRVINVAGRQRAYSQKLVKEVLLLQQTKDRKSQTPVLKNLNQTLYVWKTSHDGLQHGNDSIGLPKETNEKIISLFQEVSPHHAAMVASAEEIIQAHNAAVDSTVSFTAQLENILANEAPFLTKMDAIVNEYDAISKQQLQQLKVKEYLLLVVSLLILLLEVFFIFRPMSVQIRETIANLIKGRKKSEEDNIKIKKIFKGKGRIPTRVTRAEFCY